MGIETFHNASELTRAWHNLSFAEDSVSPSGVKRIAGRTLELEPGEEALIETDTMPLANLPEDVTAAAGHQYADDPYLRPGPAEGDVEVTAAPRRGRREVAENSSIEGPSSPSTEADASAVETEEN